ncbi:MAG: S41 family peptidase [Patescibacteria group bacterium]
MKFKKILFSIIPIVAILTSFVFGFSMGQNECKICALEKVDFSLFWEAWQRLEELYVDKNQFDEKEMIYGAISGMVNSLGDPYTVFLNPDDNKRFTEDVKGSFEGVGMEIGIRKNQLQVIAPLEGTPAQKAGLKAGDKIIKVEDFLTASLSLEEVVDLIRGPRGSEVILTIYNDSLETTKEISIIRETIEVPSLKLEFLDNNIAHLSLYHFSEKASNDFRKAVDEILKSGAERIILDLRNNPGGYLQVAQEITGYFLEKGEVVTIEDFGNGEQKEYLASGNARLIGYPLVILINGGSASASEILAGALRDNKGVLLIGEKSFGKGSVQELKDLSGGSSLKITVAKWLTPKGDHITNIGLEPEIKVELTIEDIEKDIDPQLEKAIEKIKEID